ncbi:S26 family signal peptidase [Rathayibacter sp. VKM Ac-2856]|uniref:S26 family signal peptidase n=1 Tax=unclassified Rathayibacter TaxID=2609250 RepID=UPI00156556F0|nr:S26 family signal peptidase [Rathayibacter sp. VKM Ac-2858]NQX20037.1 S26 family signal peptidase [Rathayibacter sp. VKM Ac-2856]
MTTLQTRRAQTPEPESTAPVTTALEIPVSSSPVSTPTAPDSRPRSTRLRTIATWTVTALIAALVLAAFLFHASGGRWFIVQTPSMGTAAPVGTLVLTAPTALEDIEVGDVVSFHPSTTPDETYTHRVVDLADDGALVTRGDINGATDPWATGAEQLIGKVVVALPGAGWLAKGLPMLLAGSVLVLLLTRLLSSPTHRAAMRVLGISLVASFTVFVLRPFVGIVVLEATVEDGQTDASLVSVGMLPIRVTAVGGTHVDLVSGQVGSIQVPANGEDFYNVSSALHLPLWGWIVFGALCAAPVLWTVLVGLPAEAEPRGEHGRRARTAEPAESETAQPAEAAAGATAPARPARPAQPTQPTQPTEPETAR